MLKRLHDLHRDKDGQTLGVDPFAIEVSLCTAIIHVFLEIMNLYFESQTWKTMARDYMVACYNAKQGWIAQ